MNYHLRRCELAHIVHTRRLLTLELLPLTLSPAALLLSLSHTHTHTHTHTSSPPSSPTSSVQLPVVIGGSYRIDEFVKTSSIAAPASDESIARLLNQATFGATRKEVDALKVNMAARSDITDATTREAAVFKDWVKAQFALPASLHRAYFRRRSNPRLFQGLVMPTGSNRAPCASGSRWQRYAFSDSDREKILIVQASTSTVGSSPVVTLSVDGKLRSVVAKADFNLQPALTDGTATSFLICNTQMGEGSSWMGVHEWVGGTMMLSSNTASCGPDRVAGGPGKHHKVAGSHTAINPAIAFIASAISTAVAPTASLQVFQSGEIVLDKIAASWGDGAGGDDVILKSVTGVVCKAGLDHIQTSSDGRLFRRDYRMEMVENTLAAPADSSKAIRSGKTMSGTCPSVPPTFVNRQTCVQRPSW